jgi:hypothetical protein
MTGKETNAGFFAVPNPNRQRSLSSGGDLRISLHQNCCAAREANLRFA